MKHIHVHAALAATPESLVVREVGEGDGFVAQFCVHLHHSGAAGEGEYLRVRPACASQREGHVFDALGDVASTELRAHDEAGGGHILLVSPGLDIAEAGELVFRESYYGLSLAHLRSQIFVGTLGDTSTTVLGSFGDGVQDCVDIFLMLLVSNEDLYIVLWNFYIVHVLLLWIFGKMGY